jgi:hypothetical protein
VIGFLLVLAIDVLLGGTVLFLVRRWKGVMPAWSWARTVGAYIVLWALTVTITMVPMIGPFAALIASLVGLKRISGLDVFWTFILSFFMGILILAIAGVISVQLQVDLLQLRR